MEIIIISENPEKLCDLISILNQSHNISLCEQTDKALKLICNHQLIILDLSNYNNDEAFTFIKKIKNNAKLVPIITVKSNNSLTDKVGFLNAGIFEHINAPFKENEVLARIQIIKRLYDHIPSKNYEHYEKISFYWKNNKVIIQEEEIHLTNKEKEVLLELVRRQGEVAEKQYLLAKVWGINTPYHSNVLESTIKRLRQKLHINPEIEVVGSIRGVGYYFISN